MGTTNSKQQQKKEMFEACKERPPRIDRVRPLIVANPHLAKAREDGLGNIPLEHVLHGNGSLEVITCLVQACPESLKELHPVHGRTLLHLAVVASSLDAVKFLVEQWPESVKQINQQGDLPLHHAIYHRTEPSLDIVAFLVEQWHGSLTVRNDNWLIPLHVAILRGKPGLLFRPCSEMIRYLAERCPASLEVPGGKNGSNALHFAAANHLEGEVISMLTEVCPDSIQQTNSKGDLPLHVAARHSCQLGTIQALVQAWPASVMEANRYDGCLPLHLELHDHNGVYEVQQDVATYLVEQYPECLTTADGAGLIPIQLATKDRFYNTERREEVLYQLIDQKLPLHFACQYYEYLTWNVFECVLNDHSIAVVKKDYQGYLPWQFASLLSDTLPLSVIYCLLRACPDTMHPVAACEC